MGAVTYPSLEHVAMEARIYPDHLLEGCETGLCLFAAGFLGHNDAIHFALAGMQTTCLDLDGQRIREMSRLYPAEWEFLVDDAFGFIEATEEQWDVVSADPWTVEFQKVADRVGLLCARARKVVTIGTGMRTRVIPPSGWRVSERVERSRHRGGVYWTVIEPA